MIGLAIAAFSNVQYCNSKETNKYTGREQAVALDSQEEIAMGLQSVPQMQQDYGELYPDQRAQHLVKEVGNRLVENTIAAKSDYQYDFYLLADSQTVNAFALPGGQIFITYTLFSKLQTEAQLTGVLGHEIGPVLGRHSSERIAESGLRQGLAQARSVGEDMAGRISNLEQNKLLTTGRGDELDL
jgi:predicted Zn-dependent protease